VEAPIPLGILSAGRVGEITSSFERAYRALDHRLPQGGALEALNWRVTVSGPAPHPSRAVAASRHDSDLRTPIKARRPAYFAESSGFVDTPVYDRYALSPGAVFQGPAIVEEQESTAVLGPGARCRVDGNLTLIVELPA
jgi:N-methylhydantoinase A/oxoprolinase/acetone carboxylase beta subunit